MVCFSKLLLASAVVAKVVPRSNETEDNDEVPHEEIPQELKDMNEKNMNLRKQMDTERAKIAVEEDAFRKKWAATGMDSQDGQMKKFHHDIQGVRDSAHQKYLSMNNEKALSLVSDRMTKEEKRLVAKALGKEDEEEETEEGGQGRMYTKAMQSLNTLFNKVEDERIQTMTTCTVDLDSIWNHLFSIWGTIRGLEQERGEAWAGAFSAAMSWGQSWYEIMEEQENLAALFATRKAALRPMRKIRRDIRGNIRLYRFIMRKVNRECAKTEGMLFQKTQKMSAKTQQCLASLSMNDALVKIFGSVDAVQDAKSDLDEDEVAQLHKMVTRAHAERKEKVAGRYSFLQTTSTTGSTAGPEYGGSVCGSSDNMDCKAVKAVVGQELECYKTAEREQTAEIEEEKAQHDSKIEGKRTELKKIRAQMKSANKLFWNFFQEARGYNEPIFAQREELWAYYMKSKERRFECYLKMDELDKNYYCATKHLREFMKKLTLKFFKVPSSSITDCQTEERMSPATGMCMIGRQGLHHDCIEGDQLPEKEELIPEMLYSRDVSRGYNVTLDVLKTMGGQDISLKCPETIEMWLPCNYHLCPQACQVSDFSGWSQCTAGCDGGSQTRTRQVMSAPKYSGESCPDTSETAQCNTQACDVPCELHEFFETTLGCSTACDAEPLSPTGQVGQWEVVRKHVFVDAVGKGECAEKNHADRVLSVPCGRKKTLEMIDGQEEWSDDEIAGPKCVGDEVCASMQDLVIVYECSAATTQLGCWFLAFFVSDLMTRMVASQNSLPTMRIGLVKFGNGESVPSKFEVNRFEVTPPVDVGGTGISSWIGKPWDGAAHTQQSRLMNDAFTWGHYFLGFNNLDQALDMADDMFSDDTSGKDRSKQILVLTKGKRADCTAVKDVAERLRAKTDGAPPTIQMVLFARDYGSGDENPYAVLQDSVTFPHEMYLHVIEGLAKLNDYGFRQQSVERMIPRVCPDAISPSTAFKVQCEVGAAIVHKGRSCPNWNLELSQDMLSLQDCRGKAKSLGYEGFQWTDFYGADVEGEANCFVFNPAWTNKPKAGFLQLREGEDPSKLKQVAEDGSPADERCTAVPVWGEKKADEYSGWVKQEIAAGHGAITSHYRVLHDQSECGVGMYMSEVFTYDLSALYAVKGAFRSLAKHEPESDTTRAH